MGTRMKVLVTLGLVACMCLAVTPATAERITKSLAEVGDDTAPPAAGLEKAGPFAKELGVAPTPPSDEVDGGPRVTCATDSGCTGCSGGVCTLYCQNLDGIPLKTCCFPADVDGMVRCASVGDPSTNTENGYSRVFTPTVDFELRCVTYAIATITVDDNGYGVDIPIIPVTINVWEDPTPATRPMMSDAILLGSVVDNVDVNTPDDTLRTVDFQSCGIFVTANTKLVVEVWIPDLFPGGPINPTNDLVGEIAPGETDADTGHTGPTGDPVYIRSEGSCGLDDFIAVEDIGFPDTFVLIGVEGVENAASPPTGACCYETTALGWQCVDSQTQAACAALSDTGNWNWACPEQLCANLPVTCGEGACCYEGGGAPNDPGLCVVETQAACDARADKIGFTVNEACPTGDCGYVPPANDDCGSAETISNATEFVSHAFNSRGATLDGPQFANDDTSSSCTTAIELTADVWFEYTIPANCGTLLVTTVGTEFDSLLHVYYNPLQFGTCACTDPPEPLGLAADAGCNDDISVGSLPGPDILRANSWVVIDPVSVGGAGTCLKIRVSGLAASSASPDPYGPGFVNVHCLNFAFNANCDFTNAYGRCCYFDGMNWQCQNVANQTACDTLGGYYTRCYPNRHVFDPNDPDLLHSCETNPCPGPGEACYRPTDLVDNSTITTTVDHIRYFRYVTSSPTVQFDTCGSAYDTVLEVYEHAGETFPGSGKCTGLTLLASNDDCKKGSAGSEPNNPNCYNPDPGSTETASCVCIERPLGTVLIVRVGAFNGDPDDPDAMMHPLDPSLLVLNITKGAEGVCTTCAKQPDPNSEVREDNEEPTCDNANDGCSDEPTGSFRQLEWSGLPIRIAGSSRITESAPGQGDWTRDNDWFQITVDQPSEINWSVDAEFPVEIYVWHPEPEPLCATLISGIVTDFPCDPLKLRTEVCPNTYYLVVRPRFSSDFDTPEAQTTLPCPSFYNAVLEIKPVAPPNCCKGDLDNNGVIDGDDIQHFVEMLIKPLPKVGTCFLLNFCQADIDDDGALTQADVDAFVALLFAKPVCADQKPLCEDKARCQFPGVGSDGTIGIVSDLNPALDNRAAECFCPTEEPQSDITQVCWWGYYLDWLPGLGADCSTIGPPDGPVDAFWITFYNDDNPGGRCPGTVKAGPFGPFTVGGANLTRIVAPENYGTVPGSGGLTTLWRYEVTLPQAVTVLAGECTWIEIVNNTPTAIPDCVWLWETSDQGDTRSASHMEFPATGQLPTSYVCPSDMNTFDLAFCLDIRIDKKEFCGMPRGRCCIPTGTIPAYTCQDSVTADECAAMGGGLWLEGADCQTDPCPTYVPLWDNYPDGYGGNMPSSMRDDGVPMTSQTADDFKLADQNPAATTTTIYQVEWVSTCRCGGPPCNDDSYNIYIYADAGDVPTGAGAGDPGGTALNTTSVPRAAVTVVDNGDGTETITADLATPFAADPNTKYWVAIQIVNDIQAGGIEGALRTGPNNTDTGVPRFLTTAKQGCPQGCECGSRNPFNFWADYLDVNGDPTDLAFRLHGTAN